MNKKRLYEIVFEADTRAGRMFDLTLLAVILLSILLVILNSVESIHSRYEQLFMGMEWTITGLFTLEYFMRIWLLKKPRSYIFSVYGLIDLCALLPSYVGLVMGGGASLVVVRMLRFLRIFRILKLTKHTSAGQLIVKALSESRQKISVFIVFIVALATIIGTLMYLIEGKERGFTDIPTGIYWAIVTLTTVGYGDLAPSSGIGQFLATIVMIMGYAIIAVPTGIVTASFINKRNISNTQTCGHCMYDKHDDDALFCKRCGGTLEKEVRG